jgi:hypothetical protein
MNSAIIGQPITHYRILTKLGDVGKRVLYQAEDIKLGRRCAPPSPGIHQAM